MQKNALLVPSSYKYETIFVFQYQIPLIIIAIEEDFRICNVLCSWSFYFRPNDPRDQRLPKELKQAALRLAAANHAAKHAAKHLHAAADGRSVKEHGGGLDAGFRKLDKRIDRLQQQIDSLMQSMNESSTNMLNILMNKSSTKET